MDEAARLAVFRAQVENVRELTTAKRHLNRAVNLALRKADSASARIHTKVLTLIFCAWVEATFSKLIHTPYGFSLDEIGQIKEVTNKFGIEAGWSKCLELGLRHVSGSSKSNYVPNIKQKLTRIIKAYVVDPSLIRNKIAHGQWVVALNRENDAQNADLTPALDSLDVITVTIWFGVYEYLAMIIEILIESPDRTFHRDYWIEITKLESFLERAEHWSLAEKITKLKKKPPRQRGP